MAHVNIDVIAGRGQVYVTFVYSNGQTSARYCLIGWAHFLSTFGDVLPFITAPVYIRLQGK